MPDRLTFLGPICQEDYRVFQDFLVPLKIKNRLQFSRKEIKLVILLCYRCDYSNVYRYS